MAKSKSFKGVIPTVKSFFLGNEGIHDFDHEQNGSEFFHWNKSNYNFSHKGLINLVKTSYECNPIGYSVINKIAVSQRELIITPYSNGEPVDKEIPFDFRLLFFYFILTGTGVLWKRNIPSVGKTYVVVNPLLLTETVYKGVKKYSYEDDGIDVPIMEFDLIFIRIKNVLRTGTNFGFCPFEACLMPIQSLNEMYLADASLLKNKGADVIITNGSDTPITGYTSDEMDEEMNRRITGARKHGKAVTSTANLKVNPIGRTTKELALWDGYKIKLRDVCNVYGLDASHFNDPESKKFANSNEGKKSLYTNCIIPFTRLICEDKALVDELGFDLFIDTSPIDVLQEDQETRSKKNKINTDAIVSLNRDVQLGDITRDIAIQILITEWDYDEEEARNYIGERIERETEQNPTE